MKNMLLIIAALAVFSAAAVAAESSPPLLCDAATLKAPTQPAVAACEPPPPVCPPAPVCEAPPPPCPSTPSVKVVQVPVKTTICEVKTVPVKRRVTEEECFVVNVPRTATYNEVRTRTRERTVEVPAAKMVSEAKIIKVASASGKATRLARGVSRSVVPTTRKVREQYEETYMHPVNYTYNEPVTKTRKVSRTVEEYKTVSVPRTVTTMETRVITK